MWYQGLLQPTLWQATLIVLLLTHLTILSVTIYLHRHSAHRALDLHPALAHIFRFWLWLTTGMTTRGWTAIHRKHHAHCETPEDPHSPVIEGLGKVLWEGVELYRAADTGENHDRYGKGTPDDWLERWVYHRYPTVGLAILLVIDLLLFGLIGLSIWAIQMLWIPLFAAGVINGLGHHIGYRNFETPDASTNLLPWGLLIGGEELHNNHHTYPSSAKLSVQWWEFDLGWCWIRLFEILGLARIKRTTPVLRQVPGKSEIDWDTVAAIIDNRFQLMARFGRKVIAPLVEQEQASADASRKALYQRAKAVLCREQSLMDTATRERIQHLLEHSQVLKTVYQTRLDLQQLWLDHGASKEELLEALKRWCKEAEESGIQVLQEFSAQLRACSSIHPAGIAIRA